MKTYKTSEVAKLIGIHPNTVRLYEAWQLISPPQRQENGYRVFTNLHLAQFKMARMAFQIEVLQNGLRSEVVDIVKITAQKDFDKALKLTDAYIQHLQEEKANAEEAIQIAENLILGGLDTKTPMCFTRKQVADYLKVTIDTLRNWEMNGLLTVKRKKNGYRIYDQTDINRLKIIRALRCANYSLEAILRMLNAFSMDPQVNIREIIDTPVHYSEEDIVNCCDQLLSSLAKAEENAHMIQQELIEMRKEFGSDPPVIDR